MENTYTFILLGKTGDGKSSLGNFLSGTKTFQICHRKEAGTNKFAEKSFSFDHTNYKVIDTPGFFDPDEKKLEKNDINICDSIKNSKEPISVVLMVVNFQQARIDQESQICVQKISELFPMEKFWDHIVIVFTRYFAEDPEDLENQKKNWEADIEIFKRKITNKNINNKTKIKVFYINNSIKNIESGKNEGIRKEILNYIKNVEVFYADKYTLKIEKERVNLSYKNNEPDEKYGETEKRLFRSYNQIIYVLSNKTKIPGPSNEIKRWTEKIEFFEKLEGIKKMKMKHFYIDDKFIGDYQESYEYLDINKIDHWEISCKCGFKDSTKYYNSEGFNKKIGLAGDFLGSFAGGAAVGALLGPVGWASMILVGLGVGVASGIGGYFGGKKIGEKISESQNIGLDKFEKGCPKCGKIELEIIPIFK